MLTREEALTLDLHYVHDAIVEADAASRAAAQAVRYVQHLQEQATALGGRINDLARNLGPQNFEWMQ